MTVRFALAAVVLVASACSKEDQKVLVDKVVDAAADAAPAPAGPKNLDLAKAALVSAQAKYAKHQASEADCVPLRSFEGDFADSKDPDAVKTTHDIDVFCGIDVSLEAAVTTLKADNAKLTDALKKKDKTTEQMYAATVKDNCSAINDQIADLTTKHLDSDPKVRVLKLDIDPICSPPPGAKKNGTHG